MAYTTIDEIIADNPRWFAPDAMEYFRTRVEPRVWPTPDGGALFVTSEQQGSAGFQDLVADTRRALGLGDGGSEPRPRMWSVRRASPGGGISTVGTIGDYATSMEARGVALAIAAQETNSP